MFQCEGDHEEFFRQAMGKRCLNPVVAAHLKGLEMTPLCEAHAMDYLNEGLGTELVYIEMIWQQQYI